MSEHEVQHTADEQPASRKGARRRFLAGAVTGGILGSLLAGSVSVYSYVNHWPVRGGPGGWFGHHRTHDPEIMHERLGFATDWIMHRINASEEQQQQVKTIVQGAMNNLLPLREQHQAQHQALLEALRQPIVDRQTLEELRRAKLQLVETASSQFVEALMNITAVLTPEQRAELVGLVVRFHQ
ncbi:MAG TPA: Spy/CpxP family protein refolding chaperone [Candidatus Tectomicrobia bacterium]